jgi:hypothetical protein
MSDFHRILLKVFYNSDVNYAAFYGNLTGISESSNYQRDHRGNEQHRVDLKLLGE